MKSLIDYEYTFQYATNVFNFVMTDVDTDKKQFQSGSAQNDPVINKNYRFFFQCTTELYLTVFKFI